MNISILKIINLISNHKIKSKINNSIRPITFRDNIIGYYWLKGTGFFIQYGNDLLFLTARHNFIKEDLYKQKISYQNMKENINNFFIIKNLPFCDLKNEGEIIYSDIDNIFLHSVLPKDNEKLSQLGLASEDLNDLVVITFSDLFTKDFLERNNFIKLDYNVSIRTDISDYATLSEVGDTVFIVGHCVDDKAGNFLNYIVDENGNAIKNEMSLNRNYIIGKIIEFDEKYRFFVRVKVLENFGLETLNGFSGSPVFVIKDNDIKLTGMIIRGGKEYFYFISIDFIRTYLMMNDIEMIQIGSQIPYEREFQEVKDVLEKYNIEILGHNKEQKKIEFEIDNNSFVISYKYLCHIFSLKILLEQKKFLTEENLHLLQDVCFHISDSDKYTKIENFFKQTKITNEIFDELSKNYVELISYGQKVPFDDMFKLLGGLNK